MSYESLTNRGEYLPAHYLAEVFPGALRGKDGLLARWRDAAEAAHVAARQATGDEKARAERATPRAGLAELRQIYLKAKERFKELDDNADRHDALRDLHQKVLLALGFAPQPGEATVTTAAGAHQVVVAHADDRVVVVDCEWADDADAASDPDGAGRLLTPVELDNRERITSGVKLATHLFTSEKPPLYVLLAGGGMLTLADRRSWGEGRYLAVNLDLALARNDTRTAGELDAIAALFGADSLYEPPEGGDDQLTKFLSAGRQHAVGVSKELREGLRDSVELIANEVLARLSEAGVSLEQIAPPKELGRQFTREALRYLYRILFLLYAEARPELGVLPVDHPEYTEGYSLARLGELASRPMVGERARTGFHLYDSLELLFRMVNDGHRPRGGETIDDRASESEGIRFEPLRSDLFLPDAITLIGRDRVVHPDDDPDDPNARHIDTRLRNETLREVLRLLMLTRGKKKERGGFISYAQLGINQLGAVYEGLMSYTGFIATEELYEVAKGGDPDKGSWMIPASKADDYADEVFVRAKDENGKRTGERHRFPKGSFVYRLAGRDRQTSASYYTPQSLTSVTVELALKYRLDQDGTTTPARELLDWMICEPALGSGAFLNEAIDQIAAEYLRRRQRELGVNLDPERYLLEKQKVKAYIALHNSYGVDLNRTAVELAEVSLWLNVMHPGLQAPWFGLHLRRGNSLIGANRRYYLPKHLNKKQWLATTPIDCPLNGGEFPDGAIHHFLLPASGWGAVAGEKEARNLAPKAAKALSKWRTTIKTAPKGDKSKGQVKRLRALAKRVEFLWDLVRQRLEISEREIRRDIGVWEAADLPPVTEAVSREKILADLEYQGTPYWRLKTLMDVWCALWFWPLDKVGLLDGTDPQYGEVATVETVEAEADEPEAEPAPEGLFGVAELGVAEQLSMPQVSRKKPKSSTRKATAIERLARKIPLTTLDDWLDFAESLLGRLDVTDENSLFNVSFDDLDTLEQFEDELPAVMSMDQPHRLAERFPWLDVATEVAEDQGFFHWELTFAQVFARGGFDLQIGNPPWVRPTWDESSVLAEFDPWFELAEKPSVEDWNARKDKLIDTTAVRADVLSELAATVGMVEVLSSSSTYPLLVGTQPDLYRAFMCRSWASLRGQGTTGLIHPDSHFDGVREGRLREAAYRHLRVHGLFVNVSNWAFDDLSRRQQFGVHIYGHPYEPDRINFKHLSQLHGARVLPGSLIHDGTGEYPAQKVKGEWDVRPHRARIIEVTREKLDQWRQLSGNLDSPAERTSLLYPITVYEEAAISALSQPRIRLGDLAPRISSGYHEAGAKKAGLIRWKSSRPDSWDGVVLQGPHFGISTPFAKQPDETVKSNNDWSPWDLTTLPEDALPRTNYTPTDNRDQFIAAQDRWIDHERLYSAEHVEETCDEQELIDRPYSEFYRLAWRRRIDPKGSERSLFASLVPPGATHIDAVHSLALRENVDTVLTAGFWSSLPLDYLLRITGRADLRVAEAQRMPAAESGHPLAPELVLRILRLNCLTRAYEPLWSELFDPLWAEHRWAVDWPGLPALGNVSRDWTWHTPLRSEYARRAALVEIDALVAVWLGMGIEELLAIYKSRYPILADREAEMYFDKTGRRVAADSYAFGYGQTKDDWLAYQEHLKDPENVPPPQGYEGLLYTVDREAEMRQAHAVFSAQLAAANQKAETLS